MSGKTKKLFSKINFVALLIFAFIFLAVPSCEIGLGGAVDTEVPTLDILQPSNDTAPIRGAFVLKGTCDDDGTISRIEVTVQGLDSGKNDSIKKTYAYIRDNSNNTVSLTGDDTRWDCSISPENDGLIDGSYEITVEIADTYEHKTTDKVAIKIDNTPPILVLQRPSSNWLVANENDMDTYGQDFSLVGQSADDSDVGKIEVLVYKDKECTQYWDTIVLQKIPPTVDNTVMKWAETGESAYNRLYGNNKFAGSKPYYCKLIVYDDARPCPDEGDGAGKGNSTEHYYLYNDIYTDVLSKFKLTQVYSILNGTYKSEDRAAVDSAAKVKEYLARTDVQTSRGSFRLNPLNNPTFSVNGYDPLVYKNNSCDIESEDKQILNKSQVTVKVSSGLDNIPLDNESIGISLVKANSAGQKVAGEPPIVILPAASNKFGKIDLSDADKAKRAALPITNVGSYDRTITFVLDRDVYSLTIGSYYIFDVVANDTSGNEVENNGKIYGFKLASSEVSPDLNITSPTGSTNIGPNSEVVITGNTKHELNIPRLEVKIGQTLVIEGDDKTGELTNKITNTAVDTATTGDYYNIDKNSSDFGKFQITIDISQLYNIPGNEWDAGEKTLYIKSIVPDTKDPTNKEGTSSQKERSLMYDNVAPEITNIKITPTTSYGTKDNFINGKVEITATLLDDNKISKYYIGYVDNNETKKLSEEKTATSKRVTDTFKVDTTKVPDDSNLALIIYTEDEFGNHANQEIYVDGDSVKQEKYYVNQESDRPVINVAGGSFELGKEKKDLKDKAKNILDKTSATLNLALSDDDGIAKTTVKHRKDGKSVFTELADSTSSNPSFAISSLDDGMYEIEIEVEDTVYATSGSEINKKTVKTWIGVTTGKPGFKDVKIDGANYSDNDEYWYPKDTDITISGVITGDSGSTITRNDGGAVSLSGKTWTSTIKTGTSDGEVEFTVTDIYGRTETKTINYRVDTVPPEVTISGSARTMKDAIPDNYSFSGTHKDKNGSGVDKVYYQVLDRTGTTDPTAPAATKDGSGGWIEIANVSTTGWTLPITVRNYDNNANTDSDYKEGSYNLFVYSLDKAKNCSPVQTVQFDVNTAAPTLTLIAAKEDGTTITETNWKEYFEFKYTITDTYTPNPKGAPTAEITVTRKVGDNDPVKLTTDSTTPKLVIATSTEGNVTTGVVQIANLKDIDDGSYDGTYTIEVKAKDAFNKPAEKALTKTILYDTVGPTVVIETPGTSDWIKSDSEATGTVEDAGVGVASGNVYWKVSTNTTETYNGSGWYKEYATGDSKMAYSSGTEWKIKPESSTEGQSKYLHVVAVDKNGNQSKVKSQKIKIDTKAPVIGTPTLCVGSDKRTTNMINKADVDAKASKPITITVDVTDPISDTDLKTNSGVKEVQLWEGNTQYKAVKTPTTENTYTITLSDTGKELKDGTHKFTIKAIDVAGNTADLDYPVDIVVDTAPPTGRVSSITKTIGTDKKVNGKITISGFVSDTRKLGTEINYSITDSKTPTPTTKTGKITLDGGSDTNEEWTITDFDTTPLADGNCMITITVTDEAGNTNISPITKQFVVDQTTDEPTISGESFVYDKTATRAERVADYPTTITKTENKKNLLGRTANNKLTGTITDDDNIYSVTVRYAKYDDWKTNGDSATWKTPLIETDIDAEIYTLDCEMTGDSTDTNYFKEDGDYHVEIIIKDAPKNGGYNTGYGERKISTNIAISTGDPTIESISVNPVAGKKDSTVTVSGTIASGMTPTLYSVDASGNTIKDTNGNDITIPVTSVSDGNYSFNLPIIVDSNATLSTVNLYYKVTNKYGQNTRNSTSYTVDNKAPEVAITAISPYVDLKANEIAGITTAGRYVNGKIKVAGTAEDNYALDEIEYNVYKGSSAVAANKLSEFSSKITSANLLNSWSFEIDTTRIKDGSNYYKGAIFIEVIARDKAGNEKTYKSTDFYSTGYTVDQETDRPRVKPTNFTMGKGSTEIGKVGSKTVNLFGTTSNNLLTATIEDDDGVAKVDVLYKVAGSTGDYDVKNVLTGGESTTYPLTYELPDTEGKYDIIIRVNDVNYTRGTSTTSYNLTNDNNNKTCIGVSSGAPRITLDNSSGEYFSSLTNASKKVVGGTNGINFKVESGTDVTVTGKMVNKANNAEYALSPSLKTGSTTDYNEIVNLTTLSGFPRTDIISGNTIEITYTATDIFNQTGQNSFTFIVDNIAPTVPSGKTFRTNNEDYNETAWFNTSSIKLDGFFYDVGSGVENVYYWTGVSNSTPSGAKKGEITAQSVSGENGVYKFSGSIEVDSTGSIYLKGIDSVGNISTSFAEYKINIDKDKPNLYLLKVGNHDADKKEESNFATGVTTKLVNKTDGVVFYVIATDKISGSGVDANTFSCDAAVGAKAGTEVALSDITLYATTTQAGSGYFYITEAAAKVNGDDYATLPKANATKGDVASSGSDVYKYTLNDCSARKFIIGKDDLEDGGVDVTVKDVAGNERNNTLFTISVDTKKPTVELSKPSDADLSTPRTDVNKVITLSGSANDNKTLSEDLTFWYRTTAVPDKFDVTGTERAVWDKTGWTQIKNGANAVTIQDKSSFYSWETTEIDTETSFGNIGKTTVYVCAVIKDTAGNIGHSNALPLYVNQDSDRPVITLTNIASEIGQILGQKTVYGIAKDDDGDLKGLWYINANLYPADEPTESNDNGWTQLTVTNDNWTENLATQSDGAQNWYFYAIDKIGNKFSSNATEEKDRIFVAFGEGEKKDLQKDLEKKSIAFSIDTTSPKITLFGYKKELTTTKSGDPTTAKGYATDTNKNDDWIETIGTCFGGTEGKMFVKVVVEEAVGMDSKKPITFSIDGTEVTQTSTNYYKDPSSYTYYYGPIDTTSMASKQTPISVTVKDASGKEAAATLMITVDNICGEVKCQTPSTSTYVTKDVTWSGSYSDNDGGSGNKEIYWYIPKKGKKNISDVKNVADAEWTKIEDATSGWSIKFNKLEAGDKFNPMTYTDTAKYEVEEVSGKAGIYKVPMYFKIVDKLGNENVVIDAEHSYMHVDKYGGYPIASISYPESDPTNAKSYGGRIRLQGSAKDVDGTIEEVRIRLDVTDGTGVNGDGKFDEEDYAVLKSWKDSGYEPYATNLKGDKNDWYILVPNGSTSWNLTINQKDEFKTRLAGETSCQVGIQVCAYDEQKQSHGWYGYSDDIEKVVSSKYPENEKMMFTFATDVPEFSEVCLRQYSGTTVVKEIPYTMGGSSVWLSGEWYLEGLVSDKTDGIKSIDIAPQSGCGNVTGYFDIDGSAPTMTADGWEVTPVPLSGNASKNNYRFKIKLNDTLADEGHIKSTVTVYDNSGTGSRIESSFEVRIDNIAPTMYNTAGVKFTDSSATGNLRLTSSAGSVLGANNSVEQSNYNFTFGDEIVDNNKGSGIDKLVFYFKRNATTNDLKERIYDPMILQENSLVHLAEDADYKTLYINSDDLPAYQIKGTVSGNKFTPEVAGDINANANIRKGGLVKINGAYYLIASVSKTKDDNGTTVTGTGVVTLKQRTFAGGYEDANFAADTVLNEPVEFIFAQVMDELSTKEVSMSTLDPNSFDDQNNLMVNNDDGDNMFEKFDETTNKWTVAINSKHIVDGPIEVHVVAFDRAGNMNHGYVTTSVQNNRPRLAGVYLATDINGNGTFDYIAESTSSEFIHYATLDAGKTVSEVTLPSKDFVAKDGLLILPEFVNNVGDTTASGNGILQYVMKVEDAKVDGSTVTYKSAKPPLKKTNAQTLNAMKKSADLDEYLNTDAKALVSSKGGLRFTSSDSGFTSDGPKTLEITFWDSTEGLTIGETTQWSHINVPITINFQDSEKPHGYIAPFFWKSKDKNSLYENKTSNGHIELPDDWKKGPGYTDTNLAANIRDDDPKVSGKIVVRGFVYDNFRISNFTVNLQNKQVGKATYTGTPGTGTNGNPKPNWSTTVTSDNGGLALNVLTELPEGMTLSDFGAASVPEQSLDCHKVFFEMAIDTQKTNVAANASISVTVTDTKGNGNTSIATETSGTKDAEKNKTSLQVDIVPYVTEVITSLSTLDESFPTAHSRSALGRYTVRENETVVVNGFNLKNGATFSDETNTSTLGDDNKLAIGSLKSGNITVKVGEIPALNNYNYNDAKDSYDKTVSAKVGDKDIYDNYYNRQPNGYNNNRLTDDLEFAVWQFNSEAVTPQSGMALQPIMKINPKKGVIGFAYIDGPLWFSMPQSYGEEYDSNPEGKTSTTHELWMGSYDFFTSVGMTFDEKGHSWGVAAGGDINDNAADTYSLASSRWGTSETGKNGATNGKNLIHMDRIGVNNNGSKTWLKQRFKSSTLATAVHDTKTNIYLAYYDGLTDEVRFKAGTYTETKKDGQQNVKTTSTDFANANSTYFKNNSGNVPSATINNETQAIAKGKTGNRGAGQYVCLGVVPGTTVDNDVVVAVWWDSAARKMRYAYNDSPLTVDGRAGNTTGAGWTLTETVFSGRQARAGEYCQIAVDQKGGIHIAAYDSQNLDVVYAYAPSYNGTFSTCTVDSSGVVGEKLTLDVALDATNDNAIPYIGYYATSSVRPKYAYKVLTTENAPSGAESDKVTGDWESIVVPTSSTINQEANGQHNKINVGVWKTYDTTNNKSLGVLDFSKTEPANVINTSGKTGNYGNWGYAWGNGTKNAVLGYAIEVGTDGYLETAQMK